MSQVGFRNNFNLIMAILLKYIIKHLYSFLKVDTVEEISTMSPNKKGMRFGSKKSGRRLSSYRSGKVAGKLKK